MSHLDHPTARQIVDTYRRIATATNYHPAAPSDGLGNITGPINIDTDATRYTDEWWRNEDECQYDIGCPDHRDRPALIYTIEAARVLCGMDGSQRDRQVVAGLLRLALTEIEQPTQQEN